MLLEHLVQVLCLLRTAQMHGLRGQLPPGVNAVKRESRQLTAPCAHESTSKSSTPLYAAGGMYWNITDDLENGTFDRAASSFFILVTIAFTPPFTVITVWQDERVLVKREVNQNVYGLGVFFWAKTLVLIPVELFFSVLVRSHYACPCRSTCETSHGRPHLLHLLSNARGSFHISFIRCVSSGR